MWNRPWVFNNSSKWCYFQYNVQFAYCKSKTQLIRSWRTKHPWFHGMKEVITGPDQWFKHSAYLTPAPIWLVQVLTPAPVWLIQVLTCAPLWLVQVLTSAPFDWYRSLPCWMMMPSWVLSPAGWPSPWLPSPAPPMWTPGHHSVHWDRSHRPVGFAPGSTKEK